MKSYAVTCSRFYLQIAHGTRCVNFFEIIAKCMTFSISAIIFSHCVNKSSVALYKTLSSDLYLARLISFATILCSLVTDSGRRRPGRAGSNGQHGGSVQLTEIGNIAVNGEWLLQPPVWHQLRGAVKIYFSAWVVRPAGLIGEKTATIEQAYSKQYRYLLIFKIDDTEFLRVLWQAKKASTIGFRVFPCDKTFITITYSYNIYHTIHNIFVTDCVK